MHFMDILPNASFEVNHHIYTYTENFSLESEAFFETETDYEKELTTITPLIGTRYKLTENITLDTAYKIGLANEQNPAHSVIGGIAITF